jgi:hypothetical protein
MSDVSNGPGWWQASDGKWYPPTATPQTNKERADAKNWWENAALVIVSTLMCCGLGLVLVWLKRQWPTRTKIFITSGVAVAWIAVLVIGSIAPPPTTDESVAPTSTTVQVPVAPPTVEGFPLPPKTVLISGPTENRSPYTGFISTQATYSVADMSSVELRSWYEKNPIYRSAFGPYQWCESFVDGGAWDMWWRINSTKTGLGVTSLASSADAKGVTFSVSKEAGDSTPCR